MSAVAPRLECDSVREWASLQLDGELSEFERVLMDAHFAVCADCTQFRETIAGFAAGRYAARLVLVHCSPHSSRHTSEASTMPPGWRRSRRTPRRPAASRVRAAPVRVDFACLDGA